MRRILTILTLLVLQTLTLSAQKVVFTPQWTPQSQFAGYYVAMEKGFYAEEGIDVEIRHTGINSTDTPLDMLVRGDANIAGLQLIQGIVARSDGRPLVNVMQLTQVSGLGCISREPISKPEDLDGKKISRWKTGYAEVSDMIEFYNKIHIEWIPVISGVSLFLYDAVDATLCYTYSEYLSVLLARGEIPEGNFVRFADFGFDCPEDGLYVTEDYYNTHRKEVDAFVRASKKGWEYAASHRTEALDVVMKYTDESEIITNRAHQKMMLDEFLKLQVNPYTSKIDFMPVSREVFDQICGALIDTGYISIRPEYKDLIR